MLSEERLIHRVNKLAAHRSVTVVQFPVDIGEVEITQSILCFRVSWGPGKQILCVFYRFPPIWPDFSWQIMSTITLLHWFYDSGPLFRYSEPRCRLCIDIPHYTHPKPDPIPMPNPKPNPIFLSEWRTGTDFTALTFAGVPISSFSPVVKMIIAWFHQAWRVISMVMAEILQVGRVFLPHIWLIPEEMCPLRRNLHQFFSRKC